MKVRAGIELHDRVMRYAEIALDGDAARLLRLGACDFDFAVTDALLALTGSGHLDTVATAVREIFDGSSAARVRVVVHPWNSTSFFSPLPEAMPPAERFEQLRQEAAMLSDASVARPVRVKTTPVRIETLADGRRAHWHHVLRFSESVHARLAHTVGSVGGDEREVTHEVADTTAAAATVLARLLADPTDGTPDDDAPFALAVGVYGAHTEVALCRGETWVVGHYAEADVRVDGAYFVAALLDRVGVRAVEVGRLFVYGEPGDAAAAGGLEELLGLPAEPLDPLQVLDSARSGADALALAAYVPVLGALLR